METLVRSNFTILIVNLRCSTTSQAALPVYTSITRNNTHRHPSTMPRQGDGSSDNGPVEGHDIVHGVGTPESTRVDRADKTAPLPEGKDEKGAGLLDVNASGGQSQGIKKGGDVGQGN
ncbi:hypothetical protein G7046_g7224 [Stylonectria norvegica]|nr:hypothetical protein G7046_g7224 [Stylonectria norvegica]